MTPADPPISPPFPPTPTPDDSAFDATFWKAVNSAFDDALECDEIARPAFVKSLHERDPRVAQEVRKLLGRAHAQTLATNFVRRPAATAGNVTTSGLTTQLAPVLGDGSERGFDHLLQRALRAERSRTQERRHAGELCGAWRLQEVIGIGGMGEVWLATRADGLYQATAAVKFLRADGDTERFEARFAQERALLARLNHPGIARLLDAGRLFGQPFLVLEHVDGQPLLNYVAEHASTVEARVELIREIGEAVSYAHSQLVVHRDLKPSNVLVTPGGHVKLLDFGVAGLLDDSKDDEATTSEATKLGGRGLTVEYAAPEQISGEATGVASDIYSLGSLAYHLLAGRRAHLPEKSGRAALEYAVLHVTPERLSHAATHRDHATVKDNIPAPSNVERLEGDVDAIIARAIRIDPADRYRTMEAFVADLTRWMAHRPISARREDRSYRARLWLRRNWLPVSLTASLFFALAAGLAFSLWQYERARTETARAVKTADYLVELLRSADPDTHGGQWPSVLTLIEQAQKDLATKFADDPSVEQQVGIHVATTLRRLSRFKEALPVAQRSVLLSAKLYGDEAESTRRARFLLADIMYWIDETAAALPLVEQAIGKGPPPSVQTWWREAILLRANMLAELRRFPESSAEFDKYLTLVRGEPLEKWLVAEAEVDRALMLSREGRRAEALALHRKVRPILENPPPHAKRVALNALTNGAFEQVQAGDPTGVEALLRSSIGQWDELAGNFNANSLDALRDLGFFYNRFGHPEAALATYDERLARLRAGPTADVAAVLFGELDL
ncbi:MAG: serine/threonine-protein kinase, partial [Casimicrobium sp.]